MYSSKGTTSQPNVDLEKGEGQKRPGRQTPDDESPASDGDDELPPAGANGASHGSRSAQKEKSHCAGNAPGTRKASHQHRAKGSHSKSHKKHSPERPVEMSVFQSPPVRDPDPAAERLADDESPLSDESFHRLMGMRRPTTDEVEDEDEDFPFKLATKGGLFKLMTSEMRSLQYKYRIFNILTYVLLGLQVIIGAVFIILGALRDARIYVAISALGAISTAVGGILALMKGQGLPNRLREARNRMSNVVFEAQELYWDFRSGRPIIYSDVKKIREDYLRVLEELRRNHPDAWTNAASEAAQAHRGRSARGGRR